jgi:hemolysin III
MTPEVFPTLPTHNNFIYYGTLALSGTYEETYYEEIANSLTHAFGTVLAVVGLYFLILIALQNRHSWHHTVGLFVYGVSLVILYSLSTTYHLAGAILGNDNEEMYKYRLLDHIGIFYLIAGTYTPLTLLMIMKKAKLNKLGSAILAFTWACAAIGTVFKITASIDDTPLWQHSLFYVLMGSICLLAIKPMLDHVPGIVLFWVVLGGAFYVTGVAWLLFHQLHFNHAIWHMFVIAGSLSQYIAVLFAALPQTSHLGNDARVRVLQTAMQRAREHKEKMEKEC